MTVARLAIPWYVHPAEDPEAWGTLAAMTRRPSFVVANVHSGPGDAEDEWYPEALRQFRRQRVIGYVDLAYGERSPFDVQSDVVAWLRRYRVGGVMFDQAPSDDASTARLTEYVYAARRAGAGLVVGNPGVPPATGHLALFDITCVFEGTAADHAAFRRPPRLSRIPSGRMWHLVHTCPSEELAEATERAARLGAGHVFATDREMPHPWGGFPRSCSAGAGRLATPG
jgi:hypothetical protein